MTKIFKFSSHAGRAYAHRQHIFIHSNINKLGFKKELMTIKMSGNEDMKSNKINIYDVNAAIKSFSSSQILKIVHKFIDSRKESQIGTSI